MKEIKKSPSNLKSFSKIYTKEFAGFEFEPENSMMIIRIYSTTKYISANLKRSVDRY